MPRAALIMLDGVRPDAIKLASCPTLNALIKRGSYSDKATSVLPCITLPCHTSIFHSVPPVRHGITSNEWHPLARPLPGLIELLTASGKQAAFFYNWEPLRDISRAGNLSLSYFHDGQHDPAGDDHTAAEVIRYLSRQQPDFLFVYFGTIDAVGHDYGWLSKEYLAQLERVDSALDQVLTALPHDYALVIQADHGGHERDHGLDIPEDMTIPWLAVGPSIRHNYRIQTPINLIDTAPTLARLFGLAPHPQWEGRCVEEIFE